ncbi:MAG: ABC transporter ATP-binding protein [Christensenellales bacterium]|jgi:ABC-type uncharacterized transport system ATPase subunit
MSEYIIEMLDITKDFPGIRANDHINLKLKKGEIHALLGENGAGKSTLMSILFGLYKADEGKILMNGKEVEISSPNDANRLGIGMVHQHFKLVHNFTVLENIILGVETTERGVLKMDEAKKKVMELSRRYNFKVDPDALISDITVGMQQRVEILKMLYRETEILIFDEPTAVLTPQEIDELMLIMRGMADEGKSILFITHKLDEIKKVADRCTVLRKGKYIATVPVKTTSVEEMAEMMVGRKISFSLEKEDITPGKTVLNVQNLVVKGAHNKNAVDDVSFEVREGEIVCIAGIDGNGQSEIAYALSGLKEIDSGSITLKGQDISRASIRARNDMRLGHIPEDRHQYGLVLDFSLEQNLALKNYHKKELQNGGFINFKAVRQQADKLISDFDIRSGQGPVTLMRSMSGGNQQKAIVAREIYLKPELLVAVQPTRGLDVGAMLYIHEQILKERSKGKAVLLISLELDEVFQLADRILVIYEGKIVAELKGEQATAQQLGLYMAGAKGEV